MKIRRNFQKLYEAKKRAQLSHRKPITAMTVETQTESLMPSKSSTENQSVGIQVFIDPTVDVANSKPCEKPGSVKNQVAENLVLSRTDLQSMTFSENMHPLMKGKPLSPSQPLNIMRNPPPSNKRVILRDVQNILPRQEPRNLHGQISHPNRVKEISLTKVSKKKPQKKLHEGQISKNMLSVMKEIINLRLPNAAIVKSRIGRHYPIFKVEPLKVNSEELQLITKVFDLQENDLMRAIHNLEVRIEYSCCCKAYQGLVGDNVDICVETRDCFVSWKQHRFCRVTGSICYCLYTYCSNKNPNWDNKCETTFREKDFKNEYCEYGKVTEEKGREAYMVEYQVRVLQTGLIVSELNPWIAYSPDGSIVVDGQMRAVLEIKCPFIGKTEGIGAVVADQLKRCLTITKYECNGVVYEVIELRKKHRFYGQVQLGMAVVNVPIAHFVLYSAFDDQIFTLEVQRDDRFIMNMLSKLKVAYFKHILPERCSKTNSKSSHS
ncbi:hypothetical protein QAD02_018430 [Eretmocerus hayati]|uniref:Uncharacterized protein n=1 Tax=Eretmocerus hayati TaxID=131215 RepID=A0ACC2PHS6_9HYME|nr:hypothetical protein QAD02_018430 [Eretmocerus hayati]